MITGHSPAATSAFPGTAFPSDPGSRATSRPWAPGGPAAVTSREIASGTMTTARTGGAKAPSPRDLAAALRAAGLSQVDDSVRRRAQTSTDASNYPVVPA